MTEIENSKIKTVFLTTVSVVAVTVAAFVGAGDAMADGIKIGISQPISGPNGDYFKRQFVNPAILAIEEANATGGLLGQKVEYVVEDNRANAATGLSVAQKLIDIDKVSMISISVSPAVLATLPVAEENHVVVMTVSQHPKIIESRWAALSTPSAAAYGIAKARYAANTLHLKTVATLLENNDAIRIEGAAINKEIEALGGRVLSSEVFNTEAQNFSAQIAKLKSAAPDVLVMDAIGSRAYGLALKQAAELDFVPKAVIGGDQIVDPQVKQIAGSFAEPVYFSTTPFDKTWNDTVFKARFGYDADGFAARVYDGTKIYLAAVAKANTSDPEKIRDTLYHMTDFKGVTGSWGYNGTGEPTMVPSIDKLQ